MSYHAIKKVKGRLYLYEQYSWREGNQVKTRSKYICRVDPLTGDLIETPTSDPAFISKTQLELRDRIRIVNGRAEIISRTQLV